MKENLKPYVYKLWNNYCNVEPRTICRTVRRVTLCSEVKFWEDWSRSESESEEGVKLHDVDPKPGDLSMARLKWT